MNYDQFLKDEWVKEYEQYLRLERSLSANSVTAYLEDVSKLLCYCRDVCNTAYASMSTEDLSKFVLAIVDLGISERTQARIISGIKSFYRFLFLANHLETDPADLLEGPRLPQHLPEVLSLDEINRIEDRIDLSQPLGYRNKAMIEVLYSCGLRVSEMISLQISNIFFEQKYVSVIGKGNKQRLVPISPIALKLINFWIPERLKLPIQKGEEDYLFLNRRGKHITRNMVFLIVRDLANKAEVTKVISPHTFRHSFATHLLEGGANLRDIQEMLGHKSILTTQIYTHIDISYLRENMLLYHPFNRNVPLLHKPGKGSEE